MIQRGYKHFEKYKFDQIDLSILIIDTVLYYRILRLPVLLVKKKKIVIFKNICANVTMIL